MKKKNRIKRSDYDRVLITETLPYETPIIFSNDGLYQRIKSFENKSNIQDVLTAALVFGDENKKTNPTIPYLYKIKKNSTEFRRLALIHPLSQWKIRNFYKKYERLIIHYCSKSPSSIRSPEKIAGSFYNKSSWENLNQYKNDSATLSTNDRYVKHAPSFFAYKGYDRLYKFFNSRLYFHLEKKFSVLMTLDVSKCFDSIYTHGLSWAIKDKSFTKENINVSSTFAQEFDQIIRHGNHNETNGIPIGPEVSRIFAEILFQSIDFRAVSKLNQYEYGVDYVFLRYVDDVFIFSHDEATAKLVYDVYADLLTSFNLHANTAKSSVLHRPFFTAKSRLIFEAGKLSEHFFSSFLTEQGPGTLVPQKVFSRWKLTKGYIDSIKALCSSNKANYDQIASFLISVITERIKKLVNNSLADEETIGVAETYRKALEILLDVLFFLYSVAPSVSASYKLSTSLILSLRFSKRYLPKHVETISHVIYELASNLLLEQCGKVHGKGVEGFIHLEGLNIMLAIRELGESHLLPGSVLNDLFVKDKDLSYFTIISCLFYVRAIPQYEDVRRKILKAVSLKLANLSDIQVNSEKAYLLLDMLSCPFVSQTLKESWLRGIYRVLQKNAPTKGETDDFCRADSSFFWQVDWSDVDLLNSLEKKELKQAY